MTRSVIVASTAANKARKVETSATTWGQLKPEIADLIVGDVEAIVNPGNTTLNRDDAALPEGDFKIFLVATKNKAGNTVDSFTASEIGSAIAAAIVKASQKASSEEVNSLKQELIETIEGFYGVSVDDDCPECDDALSEARKLD